MPDASMSRGTPPTPPHVPSAGAARPGPSGPSGPSGRPGPSARTAARVDSGLLASLAPLLLAWLPEQRWFAGKGRPISGFSLVSATELLPCAARDGSPGLLHLLVRAHQGEPDDAPETGAGADQGVGAGPGADPGADPGAGGELGGAAGRGAVPDTGRDGAHTRQNGAGTGRDGAGTGRDGSGVTKPSCWAGARPRTAPADCYQLLLGVVPTPPTDAPPPDPGAAGTATAGPGPATDPDTGPGPGTERATTDPAARAAATTVLATGPGLPPHRVPSPIGRPASGPLRGALLYEALADPRLATVLLERLRLPGACGPLRFHLAPGAGIERGLAPRPLAAAQSNSSVVYGDAYILKVFRRIAPGINPDLEVALALARSACGRVPAPPAWFEASAAPYPVGGGGTAGTAGAGPGGGPAVGGAGTFTLGLLQPYLAGSVDGWQFALDDLAGGGDFGAAAHALGRATAEVHLALARSLPTTWLRRSQLEGLTAAMSDRLDAAARAVPELRPYRTALRSAYADLAVLGADGRGLPVQRIHGDLHLGQALRHADDGRWSLIDFEGEPASPLAERRRPQPVVRDIAGMLRSFEYAAAVGARTATGQPGPAGAAVTDPGAWGGG
ncbi:phosphotransferase, partial [Streptomyces sp. HSW2009]|uniref:maltokinase N-terminal cap-like domain-containing protein n=1 Tax=Streptomyces sp. HSW2009 TaxID=3142890 RepID=UPI0032EE0F6C